MYLYLLAPSSSLRKMNNFLRDFNHPLQQYPTNTNPQNPPNLYPAAAPFPYHILPTNINPSAIPLQMNHLIPAANMYPPNPPPPPPVPIPAANLGEGSGSPTDQRPRSRRRGRPLGSKNKPKPVDHMRDESTKHVSLVVPPGVDLIQWLLHYANTKNVFITVLGGFGLVSQVVLGNGSLGPIVEVMTMMSISGTYMPAYPLASFQPSTAFFCNASFSKMNGTVFGGPVVSMITHGPVQIIASLAKTVDILVFGDRF